MNYRIIEEKNLGRMELLSLLFATPLLFFIAGIGFAISRARYFDIIEGMKNIITSPTILFTDFIKVGGIEAAFINVALIGFFNVYLLYIYRLKINGVLIAAFFTVIGFSFFGKNVYNILPIYLGGYIYTKYQKISFKDVIVVIMFGTALAPMISEISFSGFLPWPIAVFVAVLTGIFVGFVILPLSSHMLKFHDGYNLYNIGFTSGIIGMIFTSLLRNLGIAVGPANTVSNENNIIIIVVLLLIFIGFLITGFILNPRTLKDYFGIFEYKGKLITDFTHKVGYGITFFNMAIMGIFSMAYVLLIGGTLNGPTLAGVFTIVGFSALGKHIKNCLPVVLGTIVTALLFQFDLSSTNIIVAVLFSTTLAPIAGTYGPMAGFISGILHLILVTNVGVVHGGINLYNNGFSGGIVASVMIPVIDAFKKENNHAA